MNDELRMTSDEWEDLEDLLALEQTKRDAEGEEPLPFEILEREFKSDSAALQAGDD